MSAISGVTPQTLASQPGYVDLSKLPQPLQTPATAKKLAQATGSELLSPAQVEQRNSGQLSKYSDKSAGRIFITARDLENAGFLVRRTSDLDVVANKIGLGPGLSIPSGSIASGHGIEKVMYSLGRNGEDLTFALPNGSKLSFYASDQARGTTDIVVTDKAGNTTTSTVKASLLFDTKSQSLRFISAAGDGKFRISDLRSQLGTSNQKLLAALQNIGVASQR